MQSSTCPYNLSLALILGLGLLGCSSINGYPDRPGDIEAELNALAAKYFVPTIGTTQPSDPKDARAWRDEVVNGRLRVFDLEFTKFEQAISQERVGLNTGSDMAVIALGGTGALVGSAGTKSVLAGISAGITGFKGVIDKEVFYSKTLPVLLAQMEALRKAQLVKIRNGLQKPAAEYPLSEALLDVEDYYKVGTIPGALQGIIASAGEKSQKSTNELRRLVIPTEEEFDIGKQIAAARDKAFNEWNANKGVPLGATALGRMQKGLAVVDPDNPLTKATATDGEAVYEALNTALPDKLEQASAEDRLRLRRSVLKALTE